MGVISGLFGTAGGTNGSGFNVQTPITSPMVNQANASTNTALQQQQAFLQALQPGGLAALQSQQNLLGQLGQEAQGQGPNPALNQLAQTTGQNVAAQNALMAGQRGAQQNVGMIARQAAQQGATTQQQAAGQAATLSAQQQLANQAQLAQQQSQMTGQQAAGTSAVTQGQLSNQSNLIGGMGAQNQAQAGLAGTQMQGQQNMLGNLMGGAAMGLMMAANGGRVGMADGGDPVAQQSNLLQSPDMKSLGSMSQLNPTPNATGGNGPQSNVGQMLAAQNFGGGSGAGAAGQAASPLSKGSNMMGSALGKGLGSLLGGGAESDIAANSTTLGTGGWEIGGGLAGGAGDAAGLGAIGADLGGAAEAVGAALPEIGEGVVDALPEIGEGAAMMAANGGRVPAMVSPGEQYLPPQDVKKVKAGANPLAVGERIPGKPKHPGNDYRNDVVPKDLKEGGVVIPNSVMQSKNPHWEAMKFVRAHMAKGGKIPPAPKKAKK